MRFASLALCPFLLTIALTAQSPPQSKAEKVAIRRAKTTLVSSLDKSLPKVTLEFFLNEEGKGAPIAWEVNDCGEQSGNPAVDNRTDVPMCVQADMTLKDGYSVNVFVAVGTAKRGISGSPSLFSASVTDETGMVHPLRHLSDLPVELNRPRPKSPKDLPSPSGAASSSPEYRDERSPTELIVMDPDPSFCSLGEAVGCGRRRQERGQRIFRSAAEHLSSFSKREHHRPTRHLLATSLMENGTNPTVV